VKTVTLFAAPVQLMISAAKLLTRPQASRRSSSGSGSMQQASTSRSTVPTMLK
jgi:hypothetical protein